MQDIHYDAKGQRQTIWYGNGTKTKYTYDPLNYRLTRLCTINLNPSPHVILHDQYYWYDAVGNITQINDAAEEPVFWGNTVIDPVKLYTYDAIYRLIKAQGRERAGSNDYLNDNYEDIGALISSADPYALRNYIQTYTYDAVGNILKLKHEAGAGTYTREFSYVTGKNRLDKTTVDSTDFTFSYDARGNILDMAHIDPMNWNSQSQLSHISRGTSMSAYYQYSGGQRVRKVVQKGTITEERIYLGSFEIYRKKLSGNLQVERTTVHIADDSGRIAMLEVRTEGSAVDDNGTPAELKRFIYSNHLQSSGLELDEDGEIISYEEYHPYGTTAYQAMDSTIKATAKRYRFTGKERDEESGLNYHGARYYAPWLCRWVSVDPLENDYAGISPYNYGLNNPITYNDPSGMAAGDYKDRNALVPTVNSTSSTGRAPIIPKPANYSAPAPPEPELGKTKIGPSGKVPQNDNARVIKPKHHSAVQPVTKEQEILTSDVYGGGYMGPKSIATAQAYKSNLQWGHDIQGGPGAAIGSLLGGPRGARAGAIVDGVVMSIAPHPGTPYGKTEAPATFARTPFVQTTEAPPPAKGLTPVAGAKIFQTREGSLNYTPAAQPGISNKFPNEPIPSDGKLIQSTVKNGKLVDNNGNPLHIPQGANFIVDMNGNIKVGFRHVFLAEGKDVRAAGSITIKRGIIMQIDNGSGHYQPTLEELSNFKTVLKQSELNVERANIKPYDWR